MKEVSGSWFSDRKASWPRERRGSCNPPPDWAGSWNLLNRSSWMKEVAGSWFREKNSSWPEDAWGSWTADLAGSWLTLKAPSWTAEVAEVTGEDRKLFEPEPPSWQGLMDMVQKADEQSQFPATSSAAAVAEPAAQPSIESSPPEEPETSSASANPPGEPEGTPPPAETAAPAPAPAVVEKPALLSDAISMPLPKIAPLDYATVAQIVRETIEEVMPQIVGRIEQATGLQFQKKDQKEE